MSDAKMNHCFSLLTLSRAGILQVIFVRGSEGEKAIKSRFYTDWKVLFISYAY